MGLGRGAPADHPSLGSAERAHHRLRVPAAAEGDSPAPRGPRAPAQGRDHPWVWRGGCARGHPQVRAGTHCHPWVLARPHPEPGLFPGSARGPRNREGDTDPWCYLGAGCSPGAGLAPHPLLCAGSVLHPWQDMGTRGRHGGCRGGKRGDMGKHREGYGGIQGGHRGTRGTQDVGGGQCWAGALGFSRQFKVVLAWGRVTGVGTWWWQSAVPACPLGADGAGVSVSPEPVPSLPRRCC